MGGVIATLASLLAISAPAQALTLIGNNPSRSNDVIGTSIDQMDQLAVGFTLPVGNNYILDSIVLRLGGYTPNLTGDGALLQIYADPAKTSTNPNQATLQPLLFANPSSFSTSFNNFVFTPASGLTFLADTRYWLLVDATGGDFVWVGNFPINLITGVSGIGFNGYQLSTNNGSSYASFPTQPAFQINVTEVQVVPFEFNPALGLGAIGGFYLVQKRLKKKKSTKD